ncbi:MAG TPA: MBOAT family protein [Phycisphaerae bacterium]|nr:MBOAT family protein [Phycisphaerae bacterium]
MLFNSIEFALFFPTVVALAWWLRRSATARLTLLLAASYFFYMSWDYRYAALLAGSTVLDYFVGLALPKTESKTSRRLLLAISLAGNLGVLVFFKYFNFLWDSVAVGMGSIGWHAPDWTHRFLLPVGISFYTFQSLSYTIDVYRGQLAPTRSLLKFALFVSFFPQLVAGPIVRASDFLPQLETKARYDEQRAIHGFWLIFIGLFKKICIADVLAATLLDDVFGNPLGASRTELLLAAYGYSFQIYCDFSGYSDVAIGAAAILGFNLPLNFNRPFLAVSFRDFWRRWHISLSTWLRDYLYVPLGGARRGARRTYINLALVMLLGGLWHGANWTFVLWGALHGTFLIVERLFGQDCKDADGLSPSTVWLRRFITFHLVVLTFALFRCDSIATFGHFIGAVIAPESIGSPIPPLFVIALAAGVVGHLTSMEQARRWIDRATSQPAFVQAALVSACLVIFTILSSADAPFIYFQF